MRCVTKPGTLRGRAALTGGRPARRPVSSARYATHTACAVGMSQFSTPAYSNLSQWSRGPAAQDCGGAGRSRRAGRGGGTLRLCSRADCMEATPLGGDSESTPLLMTAGRDEDQVSRPLRRG